MVLTLEVDTSWKPCNMQTSKHKHRFISMRHILNYTQGQENIKTLLNINYEIKV